MNIDAYKINGQKSGTVTLNDSIFSLEPDKAVISALVDWHKSNIIKSRPTTKNRSEVKGTTQKYGRQKGGGGARHGSKKANIFRSGGMAHNLRGDRTVKHLPKKLKILVKRFERYDVRDLMLSYVLSNNNLNKIIIGIDDENQAKELLFYLTRKKLLKKEIKLADDLFNNIKSQILSPSLWYKS